MSRYRLTSQAREDLDEIWLSIAEDNPPAADRLMDRLYERFLLLAGQPLLGRARPELGVNLRSFPIGHYVMFYRPLDDGIEVVRVLHGARDIDAEFTGQQGPNLEKLSYGPTCGLSSPDRCFEHPCGANFAEKDG